MNSQISIGSLLAYIDHEIEKVNSNYISDMHHKALTHINEAFYNGQKNAYKDIKAYIEFNLEYNKEYSLRNKGGTK